MKEFIWVDLKSFANVKLITTSNYLQLNVATYIIVSYVNTKKALARNLHLSTLMHCLL